MPMPDNIENAEELVNAIKDQITAKEKEIQENFTKLGEAYFLNYVRKSKSSIRKSIRWISRF